MGIGNEGSPERKTHPTKEKPPTKKKRRNVREELDSKNDATTSNSTSKKKGPLQHGHPTTTTSAKTINGRSEKQY
jgi:hypothetical protein